MIKQSYLTYNLTARAHYSLGSGTPVECILRSLPRSRSRSCVMVMVISEIACRPQSGGRIRGKEGERSFLPFFPDIGGGT